MTQFDVDRQDVLFQTILQRAVVLLRVVLENVSTMKLSTDMSVSFQLVYLVISVMSVSNREKKIRTDFLITFVLLWGCIQFWFFTLEMFKMFSVCAYALELHARQTQKYSTVLVDIDEFSNGQHDCDIAEKAVCNNTLGSYVCHCRHGYCGEDGKHCEGDDNILINKLFCDVMMNCLWTLLIISLLHVRFYEYDFQSNDTYNNSCVTRREIFDITRTYE